MKQKKVLVTGAGGYIGRHVVTSLLNYGAEVFVIDRTFENIDERATQFALDIFSGDLDIYEQLGRPDVCIHMAWQDGFVHNSDAHIDNLSKHYHFVKNLIEGGLKQLSVMGTMHEIGYWEGEISENTPCNPSSFYGISKNALRGICKKLADDNETIFQWLRAYYILGDDMKSESLFAKILRWEAEGKKTFPFTSGKNQYDFIQVNMLSNQIAAASLQTDVTGIINCCTGKPISLKDKVEEFILEKNLKIQPEYGAFPDRDYDSPGVWGNPDNIKKIMSDFKRQGWN